MATGSDRASTGGEWDATVRTANLVSVWRRRRAWFWGGVLIVAGAVFAHQRWVATPFYRAQARIEVGRAFEPGVMIGVSDMPGAGEVRRLNESFATQSYDAMRLSVLAESYLRSQDLLAEAVAALRGSEAGEALRRWLGPAADDPPALAAQLRPRIDVRSIDNSLICDVRLELPDPVAAQALLAQALSALRTRLIAHDFEYLERALALYDDEHSSASARLERAVAQLERLAAAARARGQDPALDPAFRRLQAQADAEAAWTQQLALKAAQLRLAVRPQAQRAAGWVRVLDPPVASPAPVRPRPALAAGLAAVLYAFVFVGGLALAQALGCGVEVARRPRPSGPAWDGGDDDG